MLKELKPAVFLDRDGVIIDLDVDYSIPKSFAVRKVEDIRLLPGTEKIKLAQERGFTIIVVSNQPDVALGKIDEATKDTLIAAFEKIIEEKDLPISAIYYCHHHQNSVNERYSKQCDCRKPKPGMLLMASIDHEINLTNSWIIGDSSSDILAGKAAGCKTVLLKRVWSEVEKCEPDYIVEGDLGDALDIILQRSRI